MHPLNVFAVYLSLGSFFCGCVSFFVLVLFLLLTPVRLSLQADRGRDANRDSTRGSSLPLRSSRPSSSGAASGDGAPGERLNGSAFDGRLEYNYMPRRLSGVHAGPGEKPKKSAIDYQFLRLKFLLNKVRERYVFKASTPRTSLGQKEGK